MVVGRNGARIWSIQRVGYWGHDVTFVGTTGGPAQIVALELNANGNSDTSSTSCTTSNLCSFQVREYLPTINAGTATCPVTRQPSTNVCQYPITYKILSNVLGVVNDPSQQSGEAPTQPLFTYNVFNTTPDRVHLTPDQVQAPLTCTVLSCPVDNIQSVAVVLMARKGAGTNGSVDDRTIVHRYAKSPGSSAYPYQCIGAAG
ncbi:MAG: hypothetical protein IVW52_19710 [Acidimicrobiales bacterium]|nr:hypothetical protein [Acidimicrobiales bacterium]